jgi:predicted small lipoprotein YifL
MTQKSIRKDIKTLVLLAAVLFLAGCAQKTAQVTPPPPPTPAPPAPTATLDANPGVIQPAQSSVLAWQTSNASEISIAGLGTLPPSGSRALMPSASTTYNLFAKGLGGTNNASARVTVTAPLAARHLCAPTRNCSAEMSKMSSLITTNLSSAQTRRRPFKMTDRLSRNIPPSKLWSKATATIEARRNTT